MIVLPRGRRGQALALAIGLAGVALLTIGFITPAVEWYGLRAERLAELDRLARRMQGRIAALPTMQVRAAGLGAEAPAHQVLESGSDALAAAALLGTVQDLARAAGVQVGSAATLAAVAAPPFQRIAVRIDAEAPWPALIALLRALAEARPGLAVDDFEFHAAALVRQANDLPVEAGLTVFAFCRCRGP